MVKSLLLIQYIIIQIKRASIRIFQAFAWEFSYFHHRNLIRARQYSFFNVPNNLI